MPVLPPTNGSLALQWPAAAAEEEEPQLQLFNIITVCLAAASLVVACFHLAYQRKGAKGEVERQRDEGHPRNPSAAAEGVDEGLEAGVLHSVGTESARTASMQPGDLSGGFELGEIRTGFSNSDSTMDTLVDPEDS
ncbi:hypothetical protein BU26DRAFT_518634 [Trematosphaeria pertusa]|uniref:Uncharacterized protein n=1 Tax=Trematosphaeria pertusa TaxID=390896 RepID=A0A6A6IL44_9PLEO|nr:uncharacterized protein BU26DRAFT_518634 [Trematosphaeria pertusa]KAF2250213.1 hypothetical protein BU26DRAFT_518634 [Trematosphaeria pertusa]